MKPNLVFILVDDMGYGDIGAFGNPIVQTPALDALARQGVMLRQHYSASCVCAPARAALLTARYPHRTGAIDTLEGRGLDRLALREYTVADALQNAGYATGLVGKWHLGALDPAYHPRERGFGEFVGFRGGWQDYYDWHLDANGHRINADGRYLTDVFTDEAVRFIERHQNEPFFLHLTYNAPHTPLQVSDAEAAPFRARGDLHEAVCLLYGMNARMDKGVARVLETLKRLGLDENTLVVFTSDNGPQFGSEFGPHSLQRDNGDFRGHKGNFFEGGIRVPAIVRWAAGLSGGRNVDELIHFTDWMPTLLEVAGVAPDAGLPRDGQSVLPLLRGQSQQLNDQRFWQWNRYTPLARCNAAMRDGDWKLVRPRIAEAMQVSPDDLEMDSRLKYQPETITDIVRAPEPERVVPQAGAPLLFNLRDDPFEQHDLCALHPDRVRRMQVQLDNWFDDVEAERRALDAN